MNNQNKTDEVNETNKENPDRSNQNKTAYLMIFVSILLGSILILWSALGRQQCDNKNNIQWDLQQLKSEIQSKVVGQSYAVRKINGN